MKELHLASDKDQETCFFLSLHHASLAYLGRLDNAWELIRYVSFGKLDSNIVKKSGGAWGTI
jgi:hypothetical protein